MARLLLVCSLPQLLWSADPGEPGGVSDGGGPRPPHKLVLETDAAGAMFIEEQARRVALCLHAGWMHRTLVGIHFPARSGARCSARWLTVGCACAPRRWQVRAWIPCDGEDSGSGADDVTGADTASLESEGGDKMEGPISARTTLRSFPIMSSFPPLPRRAESLALCRAASSLSAVASPAPVPPRSVHRARAGVHHDG